MLIWNLTTGQAAEMPLEAGNGTLWPIGWSHDGGILVNRRTDGLTGQTLELCNELECTPLADLVATLNAPHYLFPSDATAHLLALTDQGYNLFDWSTGQVVPIPSVGAYAAAFVRDGRAVAMHFSERSDNKTQVFDLTGAPVDPKAMDQVYFDHTLHAVSGELLGGHSEPFPGSYTAQDIPVGVALYDYVWSNLPQEVQASVNEDRVARP